MNLIIFQINQKEIENLKDIIKKQNHQNILEIRDIKAMKMLEKSILEEFL